MIRAIVALDANRGIGIATNAIGLPWGKNYPGDLARFKALTLGSNVIVGRRTRKLMPAQMRGRNMIEVGTRPDLALTVKGIRALGADAWIAGGATVYRWALELEGSGRGRFVDEWHVTRIEAAYDAGVLMPDFERGRVLVADAKGTDEGTRWEVWR